MNSFSSIVQKIREEKQNSNQEENVEWADVRPVDESVKNIWAGIDNKNNVSLLIQVPEETPNPQTESQVLKSQIISAGDSPDIESTRTMIQLWIEDDRFYDVFESLCERLIEDVSEKKIEDRAEIVKHILSVWRFSHFTTTSAITPLWVNTQNVAFM